MKRMTSMIVVLTIVLLGIAAIGGAGEAQAGCAQWTANNSNHRDAGRAYARTERMGCDWVTSYYAVGSDEALGSDSTITTLYTNDGETYRKGSCTDADDDGYSADLDCDDTDATIHPGAEETCDDGIDQDCNGVDLFCEGGSCQAWTNTYDQHVAAGRAYTRDEPSGCGSTTTYYATGSNTYLGSGKAYVGGG